jgi:hypothetical protein
LRGQHSFAALSSASVIWTSPCDAVDRHGNLSLLPVTVTA